MFSSNFSISTDIFDMVKNPPEIKLVHLGDIESPEKSFLTLRHMKMKLQYPNGEECEPLVYDVIDRTRRDAAVVCAYDLSEESPRIWLRSCVRPNLALRFELPVCEDASTWELPAGLIDEGETPSQAGVRELLEETGFEVPKVDVLGKPLWGSVGTMPELLWWFCVDVTGMKRGIPSEDGSPLEKYGECTLMSFEDAIDICDCKTEVGISRLARKLKYELK